MPHKEYRGIKLLSFVLSLCTGAFYATNTPRRTTSPVDFRLGSSFPLAKNDDLDQPPCYPIEVHCDEGCEMDEALTDYYGEPIWLCSSA